MGVAVECTAIGMTRLAVPIIGARQIAVGAIWMAGPLMLMGVVTHMKAGRLLLVLAIRRRRSPDGLQRKQNQKEEGNPAMHGARV